LDRPASRYRTGGALIMKVSGDAHERLSVADRSASPCGNFTQIPNSLIRNEHLSLKALG
jgi:hypothetical protein